MYMYIVIEGTVTQEFGQNRAVYYIEHIFGYNTTAPYIAQICGNNSIHLSDG